MLLTFFQGHYKKKPHNVCYSKAVAIRVAYYFADTLSTEGIPMLTVTHVSVPAAGEETVGI